MTALRPVGEHLRDWRKRRRMSQLDFALEAEISQRHLSFMESGRSSPSREMLIHLAEQLEVPLRERNVMLLAAGYAPAYPERSLDDPALAPARRAVDLILAGHEPFPALAVDRRWNLVAANAAVGPLMAYVTDPRLLEPPVNVLRLSLHPDGVAPRIANLAEWKGHLLDRLRHEVSITGDQGLSDLHDELAAYPEVSAASADTVAPPADLAGVAIPLQLFTDQGLLSFISTTTVFGTPVDVTLSELALETFFPADAATFAALNALAKARAEAS